MDPTLAAGFYTPPAGAASLFRYLRTPDIDAMDVIGWDIEPSNQFVNPLPPLPTSPAQGATGVSLTPTLTWDEVAGGSTWDIYMYTGTDPATWTPVFEALDLAQTSVAIPAGTLTSGVTYTWLVAALNEQDFSDAATSVFTTVTACDPDVNCDGNVDQDDVICIIDVVAGNPGCECVDADFNQDGNVDQDDVIAIIGVVAGGPCP